jgi:hypothetical protein
VGIVYYENEIVGHFILFLFIHKGATVISNLATYRLLSVVVALQ